VHRGSSERPVCARQAADARHAFQALVTFVFVEELACTPGGNARAPPCPPPPARRRRRAVTAAAEAEIMLRQIDTEQDIFAFSSLRRFVALLTPPCRGFRQHTPARQLRRF